MLCTPSLEIVTNDLDAKRRGGRTLLLLEIEGT